MLAWLCVQALVLLLDNPRLSFKFEDIFSVMRNEYLPPLVRARFTTLMLHLYVDREPQTSNPQVLYTRAWSKVEAEVAEVSGHQLLLSYHPPPPPLSLLHMYAHSTICVY